jgi:hypothetical protein
MNQKQFISINDVSSLYHVEIDVLKDWAEYGLITVRILGGTEGVAAEELRSIRRMVALYRELGVNKEGIEIILAMQNRILEMGRELDALHYKVDQLERDQRLRCLEIPREMGLIIDYYETND